MKNLTSFFQFFAIVFYCFVGNNIVAQINALPGSYENPNQYVSVEIAGHGGNVVVLSQKATVNNGYRLASYGVSSTGAITLMDTHDIYSESNFATPTITKLSANRVVVTRFSNEFQYASIYDIDANGDIIYKGGNVLNQRAQSIIRLTNSSFAVAAKVDGKIAIGTYSVNTSGTFVNKMDEDVFTVANLQSVKLARRSDTRIVAAAVLSTSAMKLVCYDINSTTGNISRKGDYYWSSTTKRVAMSAFGDNKLACFINDIGNRLDVVTFEISTTGNFTLKYMYLDMKIPGTNTFYTFLNIDSQYDSVGKIHLCGVRTSHKLNIVPFTFSNNGSLSITPENQHFLSTNNHNLTSISAASGNPVAASLQADGKYRVQAFKWGN
jgi:hypothetical protein